VRSRLALARLRSDISTCQRSYREPASMKSTEARTLVVVTSSGHIDRRECPRPLCVGPSAPATVPLGRSAQRPAHTCTSSRFGSRSRPADGTYYSLLSTALFGHARGNEPQTTLTKNCLCIRRLPRGKMRRTQTREMRFGSSRASHAARESSLGLRAPSRLACTDRRRHPRSPAW